MAGFLGITIMRDKEADRLFEAEGELRLARREMEDISWKLLNPVTEEIASDMKPLDRNKAIQRGIEYWVKDPIVGQAVDMFTDYVIGRGIEMPHTDNEELAKVIAAFWNDPDNQRIITSSEAQRQKCAELQIMGNVYPTAFVNEATGHVKLSDIPPTEVQEIIAHPENRKRHMYYQRSYTPARFNFDDGNWEAGETQKLYYCAAFEEPVAAYRPAKLEDGVVFHWSINRLSDGKFGNPRTLRILDWVRAYNEFMRARVSLMRALAMFAWRRKVKGNAGDVRKIANAWQQGQLGGGSSSELDGSGAIPNQYAATVTTNENVSWEQLKTDTGGAAAMQDGRMIKGQVAVGGGFPLHYLGDIGGANLATATAMELPVMKMIEGFQGYIEGCLREVIDFAIIQKIKAGKLPPAATGRFSAARLKLEGQGIEDMESDVEEAATGDPKVDAKADKGGTLEGQGDRGIYNYKIVMPAILKRQVSETVTAVVNLVKTVDPYSQNVEASRWVLKHALEILDEPSPQAIVDTIFPPGFEYPTDIEVERGRQDTREGDGKGQADFRAARKPSAESRVGAKGGKQARQPGEISTSTTESGVAAAESALLDVIDTAMGRIDDHGPA